MSREAKEQLLDQMGAIREGYILEYIDARSKAHRKSLKMRFMIPLAASMAVLFGTVSLAAIPVIGNFLANFRAEQRAVIENFDAIEAAYAVPIGDTRNPVIRTKAGTSAELTNSESIGSHWTGQKNPPCM